MIDKDVEYLKKRFAEIIEEMQEGSIHFEGLAESIENKAKFKFKTHTMNMALELKKND